MSLWGAMAIVYRSHSRVTAGVRLGTQLSVTRNGTPTSRRADAWQCRRACSDQS